METRPDVPPLKYYFGEARLLRDWARGRSKEDMLAALYPGDGRAVIVLPGLFTSDRRTQMLRRVLRKAGYRTYGWGLGHNMPIKADLLDRFDVRVDEVCMRSGKDQVALVGWSLGGLVARGYANHRPGRVSEVITLGSPFSGDPRANRAWKLYELVGDHPVDEPPLPIDRTAKPPCPTTAIWSARDGIISADSARGEPHERDQEIEVTCGHLAMTSAPDVLEAMLRALYERNGAASS
jgi:pimeloyl-ACP methyl ester carboxylesterase